MFELILLQQNVQLGDNDLRKLEDLFNLYDDISYTIFHDVNSIYGVAIVFSTITLINESIWDIYELAISNSETNNFDQIQSFMWMIPICIFLFVGLLNNNITEEAKKTVTILARYSRTNTGADKMAKKTATILSKVFLKNSRVNKVIDKFLLKNLRQKPILTAYGFFSLDRSALFKLFTTVFTYMVVLVQFKELESSTKDLHQKGSS
ncbi:gustatory receptor 39a [Musca autumnalis]|uniref:gustatory receptor 39a n=1 Tax=Musca autumnalis TaxID=221902 RepID=UPI003CE8E6DC